MCGRVRDVCLRAAARRTLRRQRHPHSDQALEPSYNVAPRADVPVVAEQTHRRAGARRRAVGAGAVLGEGPVAVGDRIINARAETLLTSNAFKRPFERRRCIVPADGFYEWQKLEPEKTRAAAPAPKSRSGGRKQPWFIRRRDGEPRVRRALGDLARPAARATTRRAPHLHDHHGRAERAARADPRPHAGGAAGGCLGSLGSIVENHDTESHEPARAVTRRTSSRTVAGVDARQQGRQQRPAS